MNNNQNENYCFIWMEPEDNEIASLKFWNKTKASIILEFYSSHFFYVRAKFFI